MIGTTISHYKILEKLGEGGMGVVYKAQDTKLGRFVAIKILPPHLSSDEEAVRRFIHEAKTASALDHAHIGTIHEVDETSDGRTFIVMAYYEGDTLRERIDRGEISLEEALELTSQVALGLSKAHAKGIVHRDIKPSNVIITPDGEAKLVDFGLAKLAGATRVTKTGTTLGTVAYMSPEQARGDEVDARSDIWALGVMLYEMLTGKQPFRGDYEPAVVYSIMNEEPEAVSATRRDLPVEIENIVDKAITKDIFQRYQTMEEFLNELENQREELKLGPKGRGLLTMRRKARQRLLRISIPAVLIVAAIILIIIFQPFEIEIRPKTKEAIARENSIVVLPFENLMDPADADNDAYAITSLLTTGLRESEYMQVVSSDRIYDILNQLGKEDSRQVSRETAEQVAERTGSNLILTGKLYQTEPNLVVIAEITNAVTGEVRGKPVNISSGADETVLDVVNRLKKGLGMELALPLEAMEGLDISVEEVTTNSPEALKHFIAGFVLTQKRKWSEAAEEYAKAIEYDSTFATAYAGLSHMIELTKSRPDSYNNELSLEELVVELDAKAKQYSDKLPWRERMDIEWIAAWHAMKLDEAKSILENILNRDQQDKGAWFHLGEYYRVGHIQLDQAVTCFDHAIEIDSLDAPSYRMQAWCYYGLDHPDKAIETVSRAVAIEPDETQGYHARALLYMVYGRAQEAIEDLEKILQVEPERTEIWWYLGIAYLFDQQFEKVEEIFRDRAGKSQIPWHRRHFRRNLAIIPTYQGRLDDALKKLDNAIEFDLMERKAESSIIHLYKGLIHLETKSYDDALAAIDRKIELGDESWYIRAFKIYILEKAGMPADAEAAAQTLRADIDKGMDLPERFLWPPERPGFRASRARGIVELAVGNIDSAIVHFEAALESIRGWDLSDAPVRFFLAEAYLEKGRLKNAADQWERNLRKYNGDTAIYSLWMATGKYKLALAYEELGERVKAIERYEEFLEIWKDADPDLEKVPDARRRLARLKG
jgi:serine/threonine protein kinase/Tfp pilus assembly protein PilF